MISRPVALYSLIGSFVRISMFFSSCMFHLLNNLMIVTEPGESLTCVSIFMFKF
jgi:hypothetical protein